MSQYSKCLYGTNLGISIGVPTTLLDIVPTYLKRAVIEKSTLRHNSQQSEGLAIFRLYRVMQTLTGADSFRGRWITCPEYGPRIECLESVSSFGLGIFKDLHVKDQQRTHDSF